MNDSPPNWNRQYYKEGDRAPYLFYVVFGSEVDDLNISRRKHRCDEIPPGIELASYGPSAHPEVVDSFREGYLWNELLEANPKLAAVIGTQTKCVILQGEATDDASLNYFRNAIGLLTGLLECGGVAIYDPQSFKWWSREEWTTEVFEPAEPLPREHVVILVSAEPGNKQWFHTRGLRKFGRPDLSIHGVTLAYRDAVTDLFNRFIEFQAFGGVINEGQEIRLKSLPEGMFCVHGGTVDDPDFNNYHVEITWPTDSR